jgi:hypothetical protein
MCRFPPLQVFLTWTATDAANNSASARQAITVVRAADTTAPVLTVPGDAVVLMGTLLEAGQVRISSNHG